MSSNYTLDDLAALEEAIAKGIRSVKYTDKEIVYRSLDEMLRIRDLMRQCLGLTTSPRGTRRVAQTKKGFC